MYFKHNLKFGNKIEKWVRTHQWHLVYRKIRNTFLLFYRHLVEIFGMRNEFTPFFSNLGKALFILLKIINNGFLKVWLMAARWRITWFFLEICFIPCSLNGCWLISAKKYINGPTELLKKGWYFSVPYPITDKK